MSLERKKQAYLMELYRERIAEAVRMVPVPELGETREQAVASAIAALMQHLNDIQEVI